MNEQKSLLIHLGEALDHYRAGRRTVAAAQTPPEPRRRLRHLLPTPGNVIFTFVMIGVLLWAQSAGAMPFRAESAASTGTIAYQGRLADSSGNPLTSTLAMSFRLYNAVMGGTPLWTEQWTGPNGVKVSDGLFNVMLGSLTPIAQSAITGNSNPFLGITVGTDDEMIPRVQLGSVPFAVQALSVPDGSITTAKLAADVNLVPPDGSVTTAKIADGAVTDSWYLAPTSAASLPAGTANWTDIADTTLTLSLSSKATVFLAYGINIQPNSSPGIDAVYARLLVDGTPYRSSGSHYQPFCSGDCNANLNGNLILDLNSGQHTATLQWRSYGAITSWLNNPAWEDGYIGARTITAIAFYR